MKSAISFNSAATIVNGKYSREKIQTRNDKARNYFNKGRAFAIRGEYQRAIEAYEKALRIEPTSKQAQDNLRIVNSLKEKYSDEKVQTPKDEARKYLNLARRLTIEGEVQQAIEAYKKALKIEPASKQAQDNLRIVNRLKEKYSYEKEETPKGEARKYFNMGRLFAIDGKNGQAIKAYKKALEIEPNYKLALDNLRFVYWLKSRYSYEKIPRPKDEARDHFDEGKHFTREGKLQKAVDSYKKALEIEPNYKAAQDRLRFVHWRMGKLEGTQ